MPESSRSPESGPCEQWLKWLDEEQRIDAMVEGVAEHGGSTVGIIKRMRANDDRKPPHPIGRPCTCQKVTT